MKWPTVHSPAYGWMMLAGIFVSLILWSRLARRDERLVLIYISALVSAFIGAKLVYLASEGWLHWHDSNRWVILATGKSITGALLGGYAGVIIAKCLLGYTAVTGDWFAIIVPIGVMLGRVGCYLNGCCLGCVCPPAWFTIADAHGIQRWPAVPVEFLFNALMLGVILLFRWGRIAPGQLFHIYLIAYGLFRFFHEFLRDTPAIVGPFSGYQIAAFAVAAVGIIGYVQRKKEFNSIAQLEAHPPIEAP
ncbi:MAG TPA: prolipoprotein diacylglyceryl transferase family protein [Verrucomicrobiae bacterium]|nr:prolipoprotein diacylglyceryl transferase family protein [Verrucomicrobiae bacterium]